MSMLYAIAFPVLASLLLLFRAVSVRMRRIYVMAVTVITAVLALYALFTSLGKAPLVLLELSGRLSLAFHVDGLTCVFGIMVAILWPLASLYALEYMSREGEEDRFFALYLISFGVTLGIAFSANILTMYLFYELLTLSTLPLVMHSLDGKARYAGRVYLIYSMSGAALGFIAMVFLIRYGAPMFLLGGELVIPPSVDANILRLAYVFGFFGFGVKAAVFPGHRWLLRASVAPTPVTALLHAVAVVKAGVFAVARITWYGFGTDLLEGSWAQMLVMAAACFTIVYGSARALHSHHLKRRLAWSTVSNLSYILLGIVTLTTAGLVAAMTHMVFHAFIKITLFFGAGAVHYQVHRDYVPEIEGYGLHMPVVFGTFTVASLGLMGIPPLAGFSSKWLLATACTALETPLGYVGAAALIASAILTALYLMRVVMRAFFPRNGHELPADAGRCDPNWYMLVPLVVLAAASVLLGLGANWVVRLITQLILG